MLKKTKRIISLVLALNFVVPQMMIVQEKSNASPAQTIFSTDFEDGQSGFEARASKVTLTSYKSKSGKNSMYVSKREASWCGIQKDISGLVSGGGIYSFSCNVLQNTGADEEIKFTLQYSDKSGETQYSQIGLRTIADDTWTVISNEKFQIPSGASDIFMYVETPENLIDFYVDDFEITCIDESAVSVKTADVNCDGKINTSDLITLSEHMLGINELSGTHLLNSDMNSDKQTDIVDSIMLKNFILETPVSTAEDTVIQNPVIWSDVPDCDVIRVGDTYYMVSTTMFFTPGVPVMKSKDLVSWEICSYVYDTLSNDDKSNLQKGQNAYARGSWAASLRYNKGKFYVFFSSLDQGRSYLYSTTDIEGGKWDKTEFMGIYHDASILFDDDGKSYLVYGSGTINIKEFNKDMTGFQSGGVDKPLFSTGLTGLAGEGSHIMKINGFYYVFIIAWPSGSRRTEYCFRSKTLLGTYERKTVLDSGLGTYGSGVAQGGIVETPDGEWYGMLFQDHGAVGRIPVLVPVNWEDNWPVMGINGGAPKTITINTDYTGTHLAMRDDFDSPQLNLVWQWNHNPDNTKWSLTENKGSLRLKAGNIASNILNAKNTITQRTEGPECTSVIKMDVSHMKTGNHAGLSAFQFSFGNVGVYVDNNGQKKVYMSVNGGDSIETSSDKIVEDHPYSGDTVYLKINFKYNNVDSSFNISNNIDKANFFFSTDGKTWAKIGSELGMGYDLKLFTGYRSGIYNYATKAEGGYVDIDYFDYNCPRWQTALK